MSQIDYGKFGHWKAEIDDAAEVIGQGQTPATLVAALQNSVATNKYANAQEAMEGLRALVAQSGGGQPTPAPAPAAQLQPHDGGRGWRDRIGMPHVGGPAMFIGVVIIVVLFIVATVLVIANQSEGNKGSAFSPPEVVVPTTHAVPQPRPLPSQPGAPWFSQVVKSSEAQAAKTGKPAMFVLPTSVGDLPNKLYFLVWWLVIVWLIALIRMERMAAGAQRDWWGFALSLALYFVLMFFSDTIIVFVNQIGVWTLGQNPNFTGDGFRQLTTALAIGGIAVTSLVEVIDLSPLAVGLAVIGSAMIGVSPIPGSGQQNLWQKAGILFIGLGFCIQVIEMIRIPRRRIAALTTAIVAMLLFIVLRSVVVQLVEIILTSFGPSTATQLFGYLPAILSWLWDVRLPIASIITLVFVFELATYVAQIVPRVRQVLPASESLEVVDRLAPTGEMPRIDVMILWVMLLMLVWIYNPGLWGVV